MDADADANKDAVQFITCMLMVSSFLRSVSIDALRYSLFAYAIILEGFSVENDG